MLKELGHFIRSGKQIAAWEKELPRAVVSDKIMTTADEQGYADTRRELVADLRGSVLEIGCGTGNMFPYYDASARVEAIEPDSELLALAREKALARPAIHATDGDGMKLAFADETFDAVVLGLVLCSVPDVKRVVGEAFRVLKKGGQLRALEHVRSEELVPGFLMHVANPIWLRINKQGCCLNRNPLGEITAAGFDVDDVMAFKRFDTIMPAFPMRRVRAHRPPL